MEFIRRNGAAGYNTRRVGACVGREGPGQQLARKLECHAPMTRVKSGCHVWRTKQDSRRIGYLVEWTRTEDQMSCRTACPGLLLDSGFVEPTVDTR